MPSLDCVCVLRKGNTGGFILTEQNTHDLKKYEWQKPHQPNQTGTDNSYHPNKNNEKIEKKNKKWKN